MGQVSVEFTAVVDMTGGTATDEYVPLYVSVCLHMSVEMAFSIVSSLCILFIIIFNCRLKWLSWTNGECDHPIILLPNPATDCAIVQIENHKLSSDLFDREWIAKQNNSEGGSPCWTPSVHCKGVSFQGDLWSQFPNKD